MFNFFSKVKYFQEANFIDLTDFLFERLATDLILADDFCFVNEVVCKQSGFDFNHYSNASFPAVSLLCPMFQKYSIEILFCGYSGSSLKSLFCLILFPRLLSPASELNSARLTALSNQSYPSNFAHSFPNLPLFFTLYVSFCVCSLVCDFCLAD